MTKKTPLKLLSPANLALFSVTAVALVQLISQPDPDTNLNRLSQLARLNQRARALREIDDPIRRASYCNPLCAIARKLDKFTPPDTRIFLSGLIGSTNGLKLSSYYYLRNYLFPREIEISLDGHAIMLNSSVEGVPCDSTETLRQHGFDIQLTERSDQTFELVALTPKGQSK